MKPMLAKEADAAKLTFPLYAQPKLDGIRCVIVNGRALSRTLKEIPNREVFAELSRPEFEGLDGELIVGSPTADDAYRQTCSYVMAPNKTGGDWTFHVFDKHDHVGTYEQRLWWLDRSRPKHPRVQRVVTLPIHDEVALEAAEAQYLAAGYEGAILRSPSAYYKYGRGTTTKGDLLKLKRYIDFESEVIGVYEELHNGNEPTRNALGRTERSSVAANKTGKDRLGGLILRAINGPHAGVEFRCGTGFSAEDRAILWQQELEGRIAVIKSFPVGVKEKPRHPAWKGWRYQTDLDHSSHA